MDPNWFTLIGQYGFPIVVSGYLLVKVDNSLKDLSTAIGKNTGVLQQLANKEGVKCE